MKWGDAVALPIDTDGGAVEAGEVSIACLSRLETVAIPEADGAFLALNSLFPEQP
jgi:hypothetical protein